MQLLKMSDFDSCDENFYFYFYLLLCVMWRHPLKIRRKKKQPTTYVENRKKINFQPLTIDVESCSRLLWDYRKWKWGKANATKWNSIRTCERNIINIYQTCTHDEEINRSRECVTNVNCLIVNWNFKFSFHSHPVVVSVSRVYGVYTIIIMLMLEENWIQSNLIEFRVVCRMMRKNHPI
jgi:hypothetical protein